MERFRISGAFERIPAAGLPLGHSSLIGVEMTMWPVG